SSRCARSPERAPCATRPAGPKGRTRATGRPCDVTTYSWPSRTLRRTSENFRFASAAEIADFIVAFLCRSYIDYILSRGQDTRARPLGALSCRPAAVRVVPLAHHELLGGL